MDHSNWEQIQCQGIFREIRAAAVSGQLDEADIEYCLGLGCCGFNDAFGDSAVLWVTDPRSLAGGMSSLPIEAGEGIESRRFTSDGLTTRGLGDVYYEGRYTYNTRQGSKIK